MGRVLTGAGRPRRLSAGYGRTRGIGARSWGRGPFTASLLATVLLVMGCSSGVSGTVSYQPPMAPIELAVTVDSGGHVSVQVSAVAQVVTAVGTFGVSGGVSQNVIDKTPGFVVVFRCGTSDAIYQVRSRDNLHLEVDGHLVEDVTEHVARITVTPGSRYTVAITDPPAPTPSPRVDRGCSGDTHHVRLAYISAGIDGTQTLDQILAALRAMCLPYKIVPEQQDDCVKEFVGISSVACDLNTVDSVSIPVDREKLLWWSWGYGYLTYQRQTTADYPYCGGVYPMPCVATTWGWDKDSSGRPVHTGDPITVLSGRPALVTVASIPLVPMQYSDGSWHPWPPNSPKSRKTFTPKPRS